MCKAHSKVAHIKQQKIFIPSRAVDIIKAVFIISKPSKALKGMKIFLLFYKTNVRHIGILLPVSISTSSP